MGCTHNGAQIVTKVYIVDLSTIEVSTYLTLSASVHLSYLFRRLYSNTVDV